jgi:septum formation inhibitor MinC
MNTKISATSTNKQDYVMMLNSINSRSRDYHLLLTKTKKVAATLFADRHLLQKTNHSLFKANMKKQKEKITKEKNARFFIAFERVLISAQTAKMRQNAIEKEIFLKKKKKNTEARKRERAENKEKKAFEKKRAMKIKKQQMIKTKRQKQLEIDMRKSQIAETR